MKFYTDEANPHALKCLVVSNFIGLKLPAVFVEKNGDKQKNAKNPLGRIPALEIDNYNTLFEVGAICRYICSKNSKIPLISDDDQGSLVDEWMEWEQTKLSPQLAKGEDASKLLEKVDNAVKDKQFLVGEVVTLADVFVWSAIYAATKTDKASEVQKYQNIVTYVDNLAKEKNFSSAIASAKFA
ncbi:hypothetical protein AKO1_015580 [Acrasis kona]|uniref:Glutathione S-transferase n=1 Tax=Acrasis kona TaxID=1008807 RepID=A0AAW2ZIA5_9EUKA